MRKTEPIDVKVPLQMLMDLQEIAKAAGVATETVLKVALATEVRRWNRESDIRWERDMLVVFVNEVVGGVYKPKELRKRAAAVISETSYVPPNDKI